MGGDAGMFLHLILEQNKNVTDKPATAAKVCVESGDGGASRTGATGRSGTRLTFHP